MMMIKLMMIARQGTMMTEKHRWHPICPSPSSHWDADVCEEDNDGDHHNDQNIPPSHNRHHDNHRDLTTLVWDRELRTGTNKLAISPTGDRTFVIISAKNICYRSFIMFSCKIK